MKTSRAVYLVVIEDACEGMFDEDFDFIDGWYSNDATWRTDYFETFMKWAGVEVIENWEWEDPDLYHDLQKRMARELGCENVIDD